MSAPPGRGTRHHQARQARDRAIATTRTLTEAATLISVARSLLDVLAVTTETGPLHLQMEAALDGLDGLERLLADVRVQPGRRVTHGAGRAVARGAA